jgi:hypothetical protein
MDQGGRKVDKAPMLSVSPEVPTQRASERHEGGTESVDVGDEGRVRCAFCGRRTRFVRFGFLRRRRYLGSG